MAIEIPKDRSITGEEARQALCLGLRRSLSRRLTRIRFGQSDDTGSMRITETNFEIQCVVTGESAKKPRAPRKAKAAA